MTLQTGFMGLEEWQQFMGPAMCRMEQTVTVEDICRQASQGDRANRTPKTKRLR